MRGRMTVAVALAATGMVATAGTATAAPKEGCPKGTSGFERKSVELVAQTIHAGLLEPKPPLDEFTDVIAADDVDGNGWLCLKTITYQNPNAHWYEAPFFVVVDDRAGA